LLQLVEVAGVDVIIVVVVVGLNVAIVRLETASPTPAITITCDGLKAEVLVKESNHKGEVEPRGSGRDSRT
jgi:hypothetical protein